MFGILVSVIVFVVIALGVISFIETRQNETEPTEPKESDLYKYRDKLLDNKDRLTKDILNNPEVAKREMLYWLENLGKEDPQYTVWFLLNVCEKVEYGNPRVVKAMRNSVRKDTAQMYDFLKDHLYKVLHGDA